MRCSIGDCHSEPFVLVLLIIMCDEIGVVLCVIYLRDGDWVLLKVLKAFIC